MKKAVKLLSLIMAIALVALCFAGCGNSVDTGSQLDDAEPKSENALVFGTNAEFAPFEFIDSAKGGALGEYDGIDMAIADKIAKDMGKTAEINNMEFDSLVPALVSGKCDAVIAAMTVTEERKKSVDFSTAYYQATQVMIVKEDSDVKSAADLKGKKIAVVQGYTGETAVQDLGYKVNDDYTAYKKGTEAVLELVNGKCDVVVIDSATAEKYVKDNEGLKIVEDSETFEGEEYAIAVKKGNTELLEKINAAIEKLLEDGTVSELSAKYIDEQ